MDWEVIYLCEERFGIKIFFVIVGKIECGSEIRENIDVIFNFFNVEKEELLFVYYNFDLI